MTDQLRQRGCKQCGSWCGVPYCFVCEAQTHLCRRCSVALGVSDTEHWLPVSIVETVTRETLVKAFSEEAELAYIDCMSAPEAE